MAKNGERALNYAERIEVLEQKRAEADADLLLLQSMRNPNQGKIALLKKLKLKWKDEIAELKNPRRMTSPKSDKKAKKRKVGKPKAITQSPKAIVTLLKKSDDDIGLAA